MWRRRLRGEGVAAGEGGADGREVRVRRRGASAEGWEGGTATEAKGSRRRLRLREWAATAVTLGVTTGYALVTGFGEIGRAS